MAAFITGGGSGIGLASAQWLVRDGCAVTIAGRTEAKLSSGADALRADAPAGVDVRTVACDVADEAAVRAAVATAMEAVGGLHIAVLAAGTGTFGPMLTTDWPRGRRRSTPTSPARSSASSTQVLRSRGVGEARSSRSRRSPARSPIGS
jgi:NAD(P)-dependent dehydrogenase (short-subunit alcohol dehydrogenase family)